MQQANYYLVLGISATATLDDIKRAHRILSKKYHPDLNQGSQPAEEKFKEIQHAYEVLSDSERRQQYDLQNASNNHETAFEYNTRYTYATRAEPAPTTTQKTYPIILNVFVFAFTFIIFLSNKCNQTPGYVEPRVLTAAEVAVYDARRKQVDDSVKAEQGRIFLYSNNPKATAHWGNNGDSRSIPDDKEENDRELIVQYDGKNHSFDYVIAYDKSNTNKHLYFIGYDDLNIMPRSTKSKYSEMLGKYSSAWEIGVADSDDITTTSLSVAHMTGNTLFVKQIKGYQLLMVGVEKDIDRPGMSLEEFGKSVKVFNRILKENGVDTSSFKQEIFNQIID